MIIDKENRTQKAKHHWLLERESLSIARTKTNLKKKLGTHTSLILLEKAFFLPRKHIQFDFFIREFEREQ